MSDETQWEKLVKPDALEITSNLISQPRRHITRVIESVEIDDDVVQRRVEVVLDVAGGPLLVPVAQPAKDDIIDTLTFEPTDGVQPYILGRERSSVVAQTMLVVLAEAAGSEALDRELMTSVATSLVNLPTKDALEVLAELRKTFAAEDLEAGSRDDLLAIADVLARRCVLYVPTNFDGPHGRLVYLEERTQQEIRRGTARERVRAFTGRMPDDMHINVALAARTTSYHFRLRAPGRYYVRHVSVAQHVRGGTPEAGRRQLPWEWNEFTAEQNARIGALPDSAGLVHVHIREVPADAMLEPVLGLRIRLAEHPPGQIWSAAVRNLAVLFAVTLLWRFGSTIAVLQGATAVTLLLALPALLGISLALRPTNEPIRSPLLARTASVIAAIASLTAAALMLDWMLEAQAAKQGGSTLTVFEAPQHVALGLVSLIALLLTAAAWCLVATVRNYARFRDAQQAKSREHRTRHFPTSGRKDGR